MKHVFSIIFLLFITGSVSADILEVGGKEVDIPSPQGFSRVTPQMEAVYAWSREVAARDTVNDTLATYIPASSVAAAMSGELITFERYYILKVKKTLKGPLVSRKQFAEVKEAFRKQWAPGVTRTVVMGESSATIKQVGQLRESDDSITYSAYTSDFAFEEEVAPDLVLTATIANVGGKVLFLFCYGMTDDLEWTQSASREWIGAVIAGNPQPPSGNSSRPKVGLHEFSVAPVLKAICVAAIGSFLVWVFVKIRRVFPRFDYQHLEYLWRGPKPSDDLHGQRHEAAGDITEYYVKRGTVIKGPYSWEKLDRINQHIKEGDQVREGSEGAWRQASDVLSMRQKRPSTDS